MCTAAIHWHVFVTFLWNRSYQDLILPAPWARLTCSRTKCRLEQGTYVSARFGWHCKFYLNCLFVYWDAFTRAYVVAVACQLWLTRCCRDLGAIRCVNGVHAVAIGQCQNSMYANAIGAAIFTAGSLFSRLSIGRGDSVTARYACAFSTTVRDSFLQWSTRAHARGLGLYSKRVYSCAYRRESKASCRCTQPWLLCHKKLCTSVEANVNLFVSAFVEGCVHATGCSKHYDKKWPIPSLSRQRGMCWQQCSRHIRSSGVPERFGKLKQRKVQRRHAFKQFRVLL